MRCMCIEGTIQPGGIGSQCLNINECQLGLDARCDKPRAECIDMNPTVDEPAGYRCRCLEENGFVDAPNQLQGTNCLPVAANPAPSPTQTIVGATPSPVELQVAAGPSPTPPCQTSFAQTCANVPGPSLCVNNDGSGFPACICNFR